MRTDMTPREHLWHLIKDIKFAMFTACDENGHLQSRPMTTQNRNLDEADSLWFFMSRHDSPITEATPHAEVNVSYAHPGEDSYVSVSGVAHIVNDMVKIKSLWSKMAEVWFPGGINDPDLALIEVKIRHAHYWDVNESKVTQLYKMTKALMTGTKPTDIGKTGDVTMS